MYDINAAYSMTIILLNYTTTIAHLQITGGKK